MNQLSNFKTALNGLIDKKLRDLLAIQLYVVSKSNSDYTVDIKDMTSKQQYSSVQTIGLGLGNGTGIMRRLVQNDIVLVAFIGNEFSQPIILGSLFDIYSPAKDGVPPINEGDLLLMPKINGNYVYLKNDGSIVLKNSNGEFSLGTDGKLTINNAYSFPLVDGSSGQILKTNGSGVLSWQNDINT